LAKRRTDFIRNISTNSESESGGESNESTPSKILTTRKLSILLEESLNTDLNIDLRSATSSLDKREHFQYYPPPCLTHSVSDEVQTNAICQDEQVKTMATQTSIYKENKSCYTSTSCILKQSQIDKSMNTSVHSLDKELITRATSMRSLSSLDLSQSPKFRCVAVNTSSQELDNVNKSVNTSLQSVDGLDATLEERQMRKSLNTTSPRQTDPRLNETTSNNIHTTEVGEVPEEDGGFVSTSLHSITIGEDDGSLNTLDRATSMEIIIQEKAERNFLMCDRATSMEILLTNEFSGGKNSCSCMLNLDLQSPAPILDATKQKNNLAFTPVAVHEFVDSGFIFDQVDAHSLDNVDVALMDGVSNENTPVTTNFSMSTTKTMNTSCSSLVNFDECSSVDLEITLREAKIVQSPKDFDIAGDAARPVHLFQPKILKTTHPISTMTFSNNGPSCSSMLESAEAVECVYREDTRYARKSLRKARNRYSALLQQLENLTFLQGDGDRGEISTVADGECFDIVLKFKTELEGELSRVRNKLAETPDVQNNDVFSFEGTLNNNKDSTIKSTEGLNKLCNPNSMVLQEQQTCNILTGTRSSSSESDKTPSGFFDDDFIAKSRDIDNNNNIKGEVQLTTCCENPPPHSASTMEISSAVKQEAHMEESLNVQDAKFLKQRKLTLAAIENAEIKKELLLTKLEKLRLEAVLSCVLIDTESNDMTKEFQQLSMRSMKGLTSSKSTLASTASCAHLPSISSPASTFKV